MTEQTLPAHYHTLIHLGCGDAPNLAEYCALADHVWLIDANAQALAMQEEAAKELDSVYTLQALADTQKRTATFYRYSLPWANGIAPLDEATQGLYPSLRCLETTEQPTTPVDALLAQCVSEHEDSGPHLLLLDVGRQNAELLQALEDSGLPSRQAITIIVLPAHRRAQAVAVPLSLQVTDVTQKGLSLPKNSQVLTRHPLVQGMQSLKQQLGEKAKQAENAAKARDELKQQLEQRTQERDEAREQAEQHEQSLTERKQQLSERDKQLAERTHQRDEKAKQAENALKARDELKQQLEQRTQERHQAREQAEQRGQALAQGKEQLSERDKQLAEQTQQRDEKAKQAENAVKARDELKQQLEQRTKELDNERKKLKELQNELDQANASIHELTLTAKHVQARYEDRLNSEVLKVESQLTLLKDVVFRDKAF